MSGRIIRRFVMAAAMLCAGLGVRAQDGAYTSYAPYSIFSIGNLFDQGTAYNKTMGGVGIASRNNRFINPLNPAAVTARDSLAFMCDVSLYQNNNIFTQNVGGTNYNMASNTFNVNDFILTFPIYRSSAFMVGISPYSSSGYVFGGALDDKDVVGVTNSITNAYNGKGSLYQLYIAGGVTLWKNLSLGVEYINYFGSLTREYSMTFTDASAKGISKGTIMQLTASSFKGGVQYEHRIGSKATFGVGATYKTDAALKGYVDNYTNSGNSIINEAVDTLKNLSKKVYLAGELGFGVSVNYNDKFRAEFDYTRSDWRNSNMDSTRGFSIEKSAGVPLFTNTVAEAYRLGFEYVPNRADIRYYWKKVAYRAGGYYKKDYFMNDGHPVYAAALTMGATLPVFRWYNGLTVGVELGQRGSLADSMIRERFVNISLGVNIFDIWFQKSKYD